MKDATPRPPKKAAEKSGRSRAREFALQALYQHLVGHNESAAIDAFTTIYSQKLRIRPNLPLYQLYIQKY